MMFETIIIIEKGKGVNIICICMGLTRRTNEDIFEQVKKRKLNSQ